MFFIQDLKVNALKLILFSKNELEHTSFFYFIFDLILHLPPVINIIQQNPH